MLLNIDQAEYERRRSMPELWQWINEKYEQMDALNEDFDKKYFGQKEIYIKKLVEEIVPVPFWLELHSAFQGSFRAMLCRQPES